MRKNEAAATRIDGGVPLVLASEMGIGRPFLKWAGGKRQLLPSLLQHSPSNPSTYFEPFIGGGALFFAMRPKRAVYRSLGAQTLDDWRTLRVTGDALEKLAAR
jgi:DNA adenine methylase